MTATAKEPIPGWDQLRHAGLLLDGPRLHSLAGYVPETLDEHVERRLRQRAAATLGGVDDPGTTSGTSQIMSFVLEEVCGFDGTSGSWQRGSQVPRTHGRRAVTGEIVKPRHLWNGPHGASLPVFIDDAKRIGIGRGRRIVSQVLGWLRAGSEHLALVTNGRQGAASPDTRKGQADLGVRGILEANLVFAGLDYDASCEWDYRTVVRGGRACGSGYRATNAAGARRSGHPGRKAPRHRFSRPSVTPARDRPICPRCLASGSGRPWRSWCRATARP